MSRLPFIFSKGFCEAGTQWAGSVECVELSLRVNREKVSQSTVTTSARVICDDADVFAHPSLLPGVNKRLLGSESAGAAYSTATKERLFTRTRENSIVLLVSLNLRRPFEIVSVPTEECVYMRVHACIQLQCTW